MSADALTDAEIAELKAREQRNRDAGAATYDAVSEAHEGAFQRRVEIATVLRTLGARRDERILDAGAGTGRYALLLAPRVAHVMAVDFSAASLERLALRAAAQGLGNIETHAADLCTLELPGPRCHRAVCAEVLQHIPGHEQRVAAVQAVRRALVPGGTFVATVIAWNGRADGEQEGHWGEGERRIWRRHFTSDELRDLFRAGGFRDVEVRGLHTLPRRVSGLLPGWASGVGRLLDGALPVRWGTTLVVRGR